MALTDQVNLLATRIAQECKSIRTLVNNNAADLSALTTTDKTNLVAALNEINTLVSAAAIIDDGSIATTTTYSSDKIETLVSTAVAGVIDAAPSTLDTLNELAEALGDDPNFATTITTALGNRLRFDVPQPLTATEQTQGQTNLNVYSRDEVGDPTTDFVATFNTGLI